MTGGQTHDSVLAIDLLKQIDVSESNILGDKAYGAQTIREWITAQGGNYTIPPKKSASNPWSVDWHLYKERHLMECFSVSSNILEELPPAMTSWQKHF